MLYHAGQAVERYALKPNAFREPVSKITDRAKRYRANQIGVRPSGPKQCRYCHSRRNVGVHHVDGNENNGERRNLAWACKSCNGKIAAYHKRHGIGRRVQQMNASKGSRKSMLEAYGNAIKVMRGDFDGDAGAAMDTINSTPEDIRSSYTAKSWAIRRQRYGPSGRANPAKLDRCVKAVKKRGGAANAYAVCKASIGNGKVERFRINLGTRKNPEGAAADRYEYFHGRPAEKEFTFKTNVHRHKVLSGIGKLKALEIFSITGDRTVTLEHFKGALLAQDEKGKQLYIAGGDQSVNLSSFGIKNPHEHEILGSLVNVVYFTRKDHLMPEDGGTANYKHKFGGERQTQEMLYAFGKKGSRLPMVGYDVRNKLLSIQGGGYEIPSEGIDR